MKKKYLSKILFNFLMMKANIINVIDLLECFTFITLDVVVFKFIPRYTYKEYENQLNNKNLMKNAINFFESCSSHIEILIPNSFIESTYNNDLFLNFINYPDKFKVKKTIVKKYLIIQPRFYLLTQNQKTEFWTGFTTDDPKSFCKHLQKYGIEKNHEFLIMEKIQNSWYCLPDIVKRGNWFELLLAIIIFVINVAFFVGFKLDGTSGEYKILFYTIYPDIIVNRFCIFTCIGYFYIISIRVFIIVRITLSKYAYQDPNQSDFKTKKRGI